jgi:hypothetical protein
MKCKLCQQDFNEADLRDVFEHEHEGIKCGEYESKKVLNTPNSVREIFPGSSIDFTIGVRMYLRGDNEPDNTESNQIRQGFWMAKSHNLNEKYTSNFSNV